MLGIGITNHIGMVCATQLHRAAQTVVAAGILIGDDALDHTILLAEMLEMDMKWCKDCGVVVDQLEQQALCVKRLHPAICDPDGQPSLFRRRACNSCNSVRSVADHLF